MAADKEARGAVGYSGAPLLAKLGIREGARVCLRGAPADYLSLLGPLPAGVTVGPRVSAKTDVVHVFSTSRDELARLLRTWRSTLGPEAVVWVSWPKKSARVATDVVEDTIREIALPLGFVDVKVCAVTEVWSGLKLVVRQALR
jgi:hypothetical protein